jgi:predicted HicB family RNase H-like nuclease
MTKKKVSIGLRPDVQKHAEAWVADDQSGMQKTSAPTDVVKRLTIDVPEEMHRQLKIKATMEGVCMADLVRAWIAEKCSL